MSPLRRMYHRLPVPRNQGGINNGKEILTVSTKLEGEYGHSGIYIGVPAIIGSDGVHELLNLPLIEEEQEKFNHSCDVLVSMKDEIDNIIQ